jgi:hypothetical protein
MPHTRVVELPVGAAALALPALWRELTDGRRSEGAAFFNIRPWPGGRGSPAARMSDSPRRPTHLLYRNLACPITERPLPIGTDPPTQGHGIRIEGDTAGIDPRHCMVRFREGEVVLTGLGSSGTYLNGRRVEGQALVGIGDAIRLGKSAETVVAIACLDRYEA